MNPMRCALLAVVLLAGCKKEKTDAAPAAAPATTEPATAERAAPEPGIGAAAAADPEPAGATDPAPTEGATPAAAEVKPDKTTKPIVAIGSDGKTKILPMSSKVIADTEAYTIKLSAPAQTTSGADASATIELVPKGSYHLNKEFPTKLTAAAPADVKLKKDTQTIADAVTYNEKLGKWSFEFKTSAAGDKAFTCKFKFAVCTDTTCEPKKEDLAWNVSVQ